MQPTILIQYSPSSYELNRVEGESSIQTLPFLCSFYSQKYLQSPSLLYCGRKSNPLILRILTKSLASLICAIEFKLIDRAPVGIIEGPSSAILNGLVRLKDATFTIACKVQEQLVFYCNAVVTTDSGPLIFTAFELKGSCLQCVSAISIGC